MVYLFSLLRILLFCLLGELLHWLLPLPVPASMYGLILLLLALKTGIVPLAKVKIVGSFLTGIFPLLFIPGVAGIVELWDILRDLWLPLLLALIPVTIFVFAISGWITQWLIRREQRD